VALPCDAGYPWLSDWICQQWVLRMKRASPISAMRVATRSSQMTLGRTCYRCSRVVCLSVGHTGERCKKADTDRERREPV